MKQSPPTAATRPNFLWVSFEDTFPYYGCYGDPVARTPNLDALAAEGMRWTHCFSTAGVCAPARSAIITGMYAISIGSHHMRTSHVNPVAPELPTPYETVPPPYVRCFPEYLRAAGYFCTNNVKTDYQFEAPLTTWDELSTDAHWRRRPRRDQPFFAVFNPTRTHESSHWPQNTPDIAFDPRDMVVPPTYPDTPEVRLALARMYTRIEQSDAELGRLLAELAADGLAESTIVMHWSDHGPLPRGKRWPYDAGIHVPLIVRIPHQLADQYAPQAYRAGRVSADLVSTIDLAPTVLSLAGLPVPQHFQGQAFLGPAAAETAGRRYVYAHRDRHDETYDMVRAVRDQRFKYIRHYYPGMPYQAWVPYYNTHPITQALWEAYRTDSATAEQRLLFTDRPPEELYDTVVDPHETRNLAGCAAYAADRQRLRVALDAWLAEVGDLGRVPESEMVARWYPGGRQPTTAGVLFVPITADSPGLAVHPADTVARAELGPAPLLQLVCVTQGAGIAYRVIASDAGRWQLYTEPLRLDDLPAVPFTIESCAVRIGYRPSAVKSLVVT